MSGTMGCPFCGPLTWLTFRHGLDSPRACPVCDDTTEVSAAFAVEYGLLDMNAQWSLACATDGTRPTDARIQIGFADARLGWLQDVQELRKRHAEADT